MIFEVNSRYYIDTRLPMIFIIESIIKATLLLRVASFQK